MIYNRIERQVFIGGCSRSGTTLLGAMLGAHSDCICSPESHFKIDVLRARGQHPDRIDVRAASGLIKKHWRFKIWELDIDPTDAPQEEVGDSYPRLLAWIVARYADSIGKAGARVWVDHTPENISYATTLLKLFPQAKMIHIVRDGRAVAASIMPLDWGPNTIIKAARWWVEMVAYGLALETLLDEGQIMRVAYEDLVSAPEQTLRDLCAYLGIDYQPAMTQAGGFRPPPYTVKQHTLIGKKPDAKRATRWEKRLTPRQVEIFEHLTRDFLTYLGYPLQHGLSAKAPTFMEERISEIKELCRGEIINRVRWLARSYPLWLSRDFLSTLSISRRRI